MKIVLSIHGVFRVTACALRVISDARHVQQKISIPETP